MKLLTLALLSLIVSCSDHVQFLVNDRIKVSTGFYSGCIGYTSDIKEKFFPGMYSYEVLIRDCKGESVWIREWFTSHELRLNNE